MLTTSAFYKKSAFLQNRVQISAFIQISHGTGILQTYRLPVPVLLQHFGLVGYSNIFWQIISECAQCMHALSYCQVRKVSQWINAVEKLCWRCVVFVLWAQLCDVYCLLMFAFCFLMLEDCQMGAVTAVAMELMHLIIVRSFFCAVRCVWCQWIITDFFVAFLHLFLTLLTTSHRTTDHCDTQVGAKVVSLGSCYQWNVREPVGFMV